MLLCQAGRVEVRVGVGIPKLVRDELALDLGLLLLLRGHRILVLRELLARGRVRGGGACVRGWRLRRRARRRQARIERVGRERCLTSVVIAHRGLHVREVERRALASRRDLHVVDILL